MSEIEFPKSLIPGGIPELIDKDMTIVCGEEKYHVSSLLAICLSNKIQLEILANPLLASFEIPFPNSTVGLVARFLCGGNIKLEEDILIELYILITFLQIQYLEEQVSLVLDKVLTLDNIFESICQVYQNGGLLWPYFKVFIDNMPKILSNKQFQELDINIQHEFFYKLGKKQLNQREVADFILKRGKRMLSYLILDLLTIEEIKDLIKNPEINLNYMRNSMLSFMKGKKSQIVEPKFERCAYDGTHQFQGIINSLTKRDNMNPLSKGIIDIQAATSVSSTYQPINMFDYIARRGSYKTRPNEQMWFIIDFKNLTISIDGYSLQTLPSTEGSNLPSAWSIYGGMKEKELDLLDQQDDVELEKQNDKSQTFLLTEKSKPIKYLKFQQNSNPNSKSMCISAFEIFGVIYSS